MAALTLSESMDRMLLLIRSGYPVIYLVTHEESRALDNIAKIVRVIRRENPNKSLYTWHEGVKLVQVANLPSEPVPEGPINWLDLEGMPSSVITRQGQSLDAPGALKAIMNASAQGNAFLENSVTVFFDIHPYLQTGLLGLNSSLVRPLRNTADSLRRSFDDNRTKQGRPYQTVIVIAPTDSNLSPELDRDIVKLVFPLPEHDELLKILEQMTNLEPPLLSFPKDVSDEMAKELGIPSESDQDRITRYRDMLSDMIAGAGRGLTLEDYKRGLNMFAVRETNAVLSPKHMEDMLNLKAKAINNQALQYTPHVDINLGGLDKIKEWIRIRREPVVSGSVRKDYCLPACKGVMLCGVSGGGKSQLAKLIAKEFNLALLRMDIGALFGSYVGESEERTRRALMLAETLAPVVLWLDEIDKAFVGIGAGDNGVSSRVFGHFLTWLSEKQDSVFVVATANDFRTLLERFPEFGRKGRFDEIFWVDLPSESARQEIFNIYLKPHYEKRINDGRRLLDISTDEFSNCMDEVHPGAQPSEGADPLEKFCWLLSQSVVSGQMTGAEIEYAIAEALYKAYRLDASSRKRNKLTPSLVLETVRQAQARCLGVGGGAQVIDALRQQAQANNWLLGE